MIQIISDYGGSIESDIKDIIFSELIDPKSLDEFMINIIDLNVSNIWRYDKDKPDGINCMLDFKNLGIMIENSNQSVIIIKIPQNTSYLYLFSMGRYHGEIELKNMLPTLQNFLSYLIAEDEISLTYENTRTSINGKVIDASFYFKNLEHEDCNVLTYSNKSKKATTCILRDNLILTTLNLNMMDLDDFLNEIDLIEKKEDIPIWIKELVMFNDQENKDIIVHNEKLIEECYGNIEEAKKKIDMNNELKSILCSNGDHLVRIVFEILEDMFKCDLSNFEDKKQEDFLINCGEITFIGEIKGVNHNVKSENISQLDVHYQSYLEEHPDKDEQNVKALLIMAHQKNKPLESREPVHEKQIQLATRNGSLIIETITLLRLYEKYKNREIISDDCIKLFSENIGLLKYND